MTVYKKCSNHSALLNKIATRAINRKKALNNFFCLTGGQILKKFGSSDAQVSDPGPSWPSCLSRLTDKQIIRQKLKVNFLLRSLLTPSCFFSLFLSWFACLKYEALSHGALLLPKEFAPVGAIFFPFRVEPIQKGGNDENPVGANFFI